jgi:ppGpp synthetase/RelA/SpoT-type nucleotidyltranferase
MTRKTDAKCQEWTRRQLKKYKQRHRNYVLYAEVLERILTQAAKKLAPLAIVQTRPKSIASFAEKCQRKKAKYKEPVSQFTDLCGGRVIVHTADEVRAISEFIEKHFQIDEENSIDVSQRLKPTEFGYRSVHYIISFKPGVFPSRDVAVKVPPLLFDDKKFPNRRAEVQVRTILEHAWADMAHVLAYKSSFQIPEKWQREFAGVAAMLEGADKTFSRIQQGMKVYSASYGAYMTEEQMRDEIGLLEIILESDQENVELAGRIGKLAITLGDWPKAVEVLSRYVDSGNPSILRDLGVALCKMHKNKPKSRIYRQGQRYLEAACKPPNEDADALSSLAGTWKGIDEDRMRKLYREAFQLDPTDPYPLENYLDLEINLAKDTSIVSLLNPVISSAIQRCLDQADVGVNLPWAFYMMGKFYLLLNEPFKSLESYAKAIQLSPASWMIKTALNSLQRLEKVKNELSGYEWARRLLLVGRAMMANKKAKEAIGEIEKAKKAIDKAKKVKEQREKAKEAKEATKELKKLATSQGKPIQGPVVIMVGGCDPSIEQQMKSYRHLALEGFRDYRGTIISGGTIEGISGLVGDVGEEYRKSIRTIGYLPELIPADATVDKRYSEIRKTEGSGFSPLEPLQNWIDIIAAGLEPSEVKVLGINGGRIAAIEYRIALALGATVGVVEESGREVAKLLRDEKWLSLKKLVHLPADAMTVRAFIGSGSPKLETDVRERLAKEIHEAYRLTKKDSLKTDDPAMADWEKLRDDFKESNAQQADHAFEKLREIECTVKKVSGRKIKLITFTRDEVELLADMEHGRWNAERLLEGWTWGEKKDAVRKISPYLVSWSELAEDVKNWDRETVRKIPEFLAKIGLEIRRRP